MIYWIFHSLFNFANWKLLLPTMRKITFYNKTDTEPKPKPYFHHQNFRKNLSSKSPSLRCANLFGKIFYFIVLISWFFPKSLHDCRTRKRFFYSKESAISLQKRLSDRFYFLFRYIWSKRKLKSIEILMVSYQKLLHIIFI